MPKTSARRINGSMREGSRNAPGALRTRSERMRKMVLVKFEYRDSWSHGEWCRQEGTFDSVQECIEWYGLGIDCDDRILSVEEI